MNAVPVVPLARLSAAPAGTPHSSSRAGTRVRHAAASGIATLRTKFSVARACVSEATDALLRGGLPQPVAVPVREARAASLCLFAEESGIACIMEMVHDGEDVASLKGQILHGSLVGDFTVELWEAGACTPFASVAAHKLGYFALSSIPAGDWTLVVQPSQCPPSHPARRTFAPATGSRWIRRNQAFGKESQH